MRIIIDCTQIPLNRTGVGVYADNLVRELLLRLEKEDKLFILVQSDDMALKNCVTSAPNARTIIIPSLLCRNHLVLALFEQFILPVLALYYRVDIVHSIHYRFPLLSFCKNVVTIHDLTHSLFPEVHTRARRIVMAFFSRIALKRAHGLLFDSASTQRDFEQVFGSGKNRQFVAPLGVSAALFSPPPDEAIRDTLDRHRIRRPFLLYLGTIEPRKNIDRLIDAFDNIGKNYPQYLLVIAGRLGWSYGEVLSKIDSSPLRRSILRLGYVSAADKHALLASCEVLVYPSIYEGFGLPVLEGMAMAKPVITSNTSSLLEVAGNGAVTIDPTSTDQIAESLDRILSSADLRKLLGENAQRQAARFTWQKTAEITYQAYRAVTGANSSV